MTLRRPRRLVVLIQPRLLEGALAVVLAAEWHVTTSQQLSSSARRSFDLALVTGEPPQRVHAPIVVKLSAGRADEPMTVEVRAGGEVREVVVDDLAGLLGVLRTELAAPPGP